MTNWFQSSDFKAINLTIFPFALSLSKPVIVLSMSSQRNS